MDFMVELDNFTREGLLLELVCGEQVIGTLHLSVLLLTLTNVDGELPVYSIT